MTQLFAPTDGPTEKIEDTPEVWGEESLSAAEKHLANWRDWNAESERLRVASQPPAPYVRPINRAVSAELRELAIKLAGTSKHGELPGMIDKLATIKANPTIYPASELRMSVDPFRDQTDLIFEVVKSAASDARAVLEIAKELVEYLNKEISDNS